MYSGLDLAKAGLRSLLQKGIREVQADMIKDFVDLGDFETAKLLMDAKFQVVFLDE